MILFRLSHYIKSTNTINTLKQFYQLRYYDVSIYIDYTKNDKAYEEISMLFGKFQSYRLSFDNGNYIDLYLPLVDTYYILKCISCNKICTTTIKVLKNSVYSIEKILNNSKIQEDKMTQISLITNLKY